MSLTIPFEIQKVEPEMVELYYGNKKRFSTMTSVVFINDKLLACASYYAKELYLVEFDVKEQTYNILDTIATHGPSDLIDYNGEGELIISNFNHCSVSIYRVDESVKFKHVKTIQNKELGYCHGISYYPWNHNLIFIGTSGTTNPNCGAYAIQLSDGKPIFGIKEIGWLCKDICFMDSENMFAIYCNSAPNPNIKRQYSAKIVWYYIDLENQQYKKITEKMLFRHHTDSCKYHNGKLYITVESIEAGGKVLIFDIDTENSKLSDNRSIDGYNFPHGIDINYGMVAVSEYGRSDIVIQTLTLIK